MTNVVLLANADSVDNVVEGGKGALEATQEVGQKLAGTGQETWQRVTTQVTELVAGYLPNVVAALLVLIVGWLT